MGLDTAKLKADMDFNAGTVLDGMPMQQAAEDLFDKWSFPAWLKAPVAGVTIGVIGYFFPQVFGTGFPAMTQARARSPTRFRPELAAVGGMR